jgi:hypothetical protein
MAQHYMPSYSSTDPFPLVKKPRTEATLHRSARTRIWLSRVLFTVLFAGVLALFAYEVQVARQSGWRPNLHTLTGK